MERHEIQSSGEMYGFVPQNGGVPSSDFQTPGGPSQSASYYPQNQPGMDGINAFFSSAPSQFIGRQFVQEGRHYVQSFQERIGVLSGSVLNYHFAINNEYVRTKLLVLLTPYLKRWNFSRLPEQIPGGPKFRAPRADVNCPDLYIPLMAFFSFCIFSSVFKFTSTDIMYSKVSTALLGWFLHICAFKVLAYTMNLSSTLTWIESLCYTGYMFVLLTFQVLGSWIRVRFTFLLFWIYSSLCMGVFLVRSLKRLMYHEARHYGNSKTCLFNFGYRFMVLGGDINRFNYLLLCLACFQFVLFYFLRP